MGACLYRTAVTAVVVLGLLVLAPAAEPTAAGGLAAPAVSEFAPGKTWTDTDGNVLQMHGLGIIKVGNAWYGFGEDKTGESSSDAAFQAIPCYLSTDLADWMYQGRALTRQPSGDLGPDRVVERPKVIYNAATQTYVMYMHIDDSSYSEAKVGVATSATPCGPYSYRGSFQPLGNQSRDIGLFQDADGSAYLLSEDRANGLRIDKLSADYLSVVSAVAVLPDYEAPAMVEVGGTYYLFASHLTGWSTNDNVYATAGSLSGPWSGFQTFAPSGTDTYNSQTANIIPVQGTSGTTHIYAGDRWETSDLGNSPLIWLPLTIHGNSVSMSWYSEWSLDTTAGTSTAQTTRLVGTQSGRCLDVANQDVTAGSVVDIWDCNGGANQRWNINPDGTIVGVQSGLCLDVANQDTTPGSAVDIWDCNGGANQQWKINPDGTIVGVQSGLCLDVADQGTGNGSAIVVWTCDGGASQQWSRPDAPPTSTTLASSANPSVVGQEVTFTATVSGPPGSSETPTGTVTFKDGSETIGNDSLEVVDGKAQASSPPDELAEGTHRITAVYSGDDTFGGSTSPVLRQTVNPAATTTSLSSSANPSVVGEPVTFTATVAAVPPGVLEFGTVTFMDGDTRIGAVWLQPPDDQVSLTTSLLSVGTHAITAVFSGNGSNSGSTSTVLEQVIDPIAELSPSTHDFGRRSVEAGPSPPFAFTLANDGDTPVTISQVTLTGQDPGAFSADRSACPGTLAAGADCQITVRFDPTTPAAASAVLGVETDVDTVTASLAGDASPPPPPAPPPAVRPPSLPPPPPIVGPPSTSTPAKPKLRLSVTASRSRVRPGQRIRYRLTARNTGKGPAKGVRLCDRLPGQLTLLTTERQLAKRGGRLRRRKVCWTMERMGPRAKVVRTLLARVDREARAQRIVNRATLNSTNVKGIDAKVRRTVKVGPAKRKARTRHATH